MNSLPAVNKIPSVQPISYCQTSNKAHGLRPVDRLKSEEGHSWMDFDRNHHLECNIKSLMNSFPQEQGHCFDLSLYEWNMSLPKQIKEKETLSHNFTQSLCNTKSLDNCKEDQPIKVEGSQDNDIVGKKEGNLSQSEVKMEEEGGKLEKKKLEEKNKNKEIQKIKGGISFGEIKGMKMTGKSFIWNEENDRILMNLASKFRNDWKKVSQEFAHKVFGINLLKERYQKITSNYLQKRKKFTHKEDLKIVEYFDKFGPDWTKIATHFQSRTGVMLKNRYYSYIRKQNLYESLLAEVQNCKKDDEQINELSTGAVSHVEKGEIGDDLDPHKDVISEQLSPNIPYNYQRDIFEKKDNPEKELCEKITLSLNAKEGFSMGVPIIENNMITIEVFREKVNCKRKEESEEEGYKLQSLKDKVKSLQMLLLATNKKLKSLQES